MFKKSLVVLVALIFIPALVLAVNTTTVGSSKKVIQIVPDGSTDWVWEDDLSGEGSAVLRGKIKRIIFYPSAANDRMIIHDGGIDNAAYFDSGLTSGADDPRTVIYDPAIPVRLVIDATDNTTSTPGSCTILIYLE